MNSQHEERISQLLGELRENESSSNVSDDSRTQPGASACRDRYSAPDGHYVGGSYNRDEGTCVCLDSSQEIIGQKLAFRVRTCAYVVDKLFIQIRVLTSV